MRFTVGPVAVATGHRHTPPRPSAETSNPLAPNVRVFMAVTPPSRRTDDAGAHFSTDVLRSGSRQRVCAQHDGSHGDWTSRAIDRTYSNDLVCRIDNSDASTTYRHPASRPAEQLGNAQ